MKLTKGLSKVEEHYYRYSFIFIEVYATIHSIIFVPKMLAMLLVFLYIWYYGGFEKDEEGESNHLQCLEKILNESNFEADNKELPENLEHAHQIIVESIN